MRTVRLAALGFTLLFVGAGCGAKTEGTAAVNANGANANANARAEAEAVKKSGGDEGENVRPTASVAVTGTTAVAKGKAKPNQQVFGYVDLKTEERKCVTPNTFATGGSGRADAQGNYSWEMPLLAIGAHTFSVVAVDDAAAYGGTACFPETSGSTVVNFFLSEKPLAP